MSNLLYLLQNTIPMSLSKCIIFYDLATNNQDVYCHSMVICVSIYLEFTCCAPFLIFFECVFSLLFSLFPGVIMICIVSFYSNTRMQRKYQRIQIENVIRFTDNNNFVQKNKQCFGLRTIHNITFNAAKQCVRPSSNKQIKFI